MKKDLGTIPDLERSSQPKSNNPKRVDNYEKPPNFEIKPRKQ